MIEPTTAMAEMALVSDISGVCSSRETLRITSRPVNVASISTYSRVRKSGLRRRLPARRVCQQGQSMRSDIDEAVSFRYGKGSSSVTSVSIRAFSFCKPAVFYRHVLARRRRPATASPAD